MKKLQHLINFGKMPKHQDKDEKLLMEWRFSLKNNNHESLPDKFDYHQYNQEHLFEIPT